MEVLFKILFGVVVLSFVVFLLQRSDVISNPLCCTECGGDVVGEFYDSSAKQHILVRAKEGESTSSAMRRVIAAHN